MTDLVSYTVKLTTGMIEVREVLPDGSNHRRVIRPGDKVSQEKKTLRDVCALHHTPTVVSKYRKSINRREQDHEAKA